MRMLNVNVNPVTMETHVNSCAMDKEHVLILKMERCVTVVLVVGEAPHVA